MTKKKVKKNNKPVDGMTHVSEVLKGKIPDKTKTKKPTASLTKQGLTMEQELFCQCYVSPDREMFGNGMHSYINAYGYKDGEGGRIINQNSLMAAASRLLRNVKVIKRINQLLEQGGFTDENVDKQHLFLINQHVDFKTKLGAIKEYNVLKKRVDNKPEITLYIPSEEERKKAQDALNQFLKSNDNSRNSTIGK